MVATPVRGLSDHRMGTLSLSATRKPSEARRAGTRRAPVKAVERLLGLRSRACLPAWLLSPDHVLEDSLTAE